MTPKQRDAISSLQEQIGSVESYIGRLRRKLDALPDYFESSQDDGEFTTDEINELLRLNSRFANFKLSS